MKDGCDIEWLDGNCPVMGEGVFRADGVSHRFSFRARGKRISLTVSMDDPGADPEACAGVWEWSMGVSEEFAAGWIPHGLARSIIEWGFERWRHHLAEREDGPPEG